MIKIGEFSKMCKLTIKTLRFYETKGLIKPFYIDPYTNYRYYNSSQLVDVFKVISLRQCGLSLGEIKDVLNGKDINIILKKKKEEINHTIDDYHKMLFNINYLLKVKKMESKIVLKEIPSYIVYYKDGIIKDFSQISEYAYNVGLKCANANPNLKCIEPDYCYISYLDNQYKEENIKIRYAQAVEGFGNEIDDIKFMQIPAVTVVSLYHKGSYSNLRESYQIILNYIEENDYEICDSVRECYIDGCWNKDKEEDYLTEIQFPVKRK